MLQTIVSACFSLTLYIMLEVKIKSRLKAFKLEIYWFSILSPSPSIYMNNMRLEEKGNWELSLVKKKAYNIFVSNLNVYNVKVVLLFHHSTHLSTTFYSCSCKCGSPASRINGAISRTVQSAVQVIYIHQWIQFLGFFGSKNKWFNSINLAKLFGLETI